MRRGPEQLRRDAVQIWLAGLEAVRSDRLVQNVVQVASQRLTLGNESIALANVRRIAVVGGGKAGAGMVAGLEAALGPALLAEKHVTGWVNVPADCVRPTTHIHLHAARPAGVNEPTAEAVAGTQRIQELVGSLGPDDLCICLISGGASALLPAPADGITLADKLAVTRHLSGAGANIAELNTVRKQLSRIKGGGLWRACRAGRLIALVISDVPGDPLDIIASGPTVADSSTAAEALKVLERFKAREAEIALSVFELLAAQQHTPPQPPSYPATTLLIGSNAVAVDAAAAEAVRLGYTPTTSAARAMEPSAEEIGRRLAKEAIQMREGTGPDCLISGGEPVVTLAPAAERGRGGRNQQLVLAALETLAASDAQGIALVSGGTDGEDGPTDAAGALVDAEIIAAAGQRGLQPHDFLRRNDAYRFFEPLGGLLKTGPTHTNVCDVRVIVVDKNA